MVDRHICGISCEVVFVLTQSLAVPGVDHWVSAGFHWVSPGVFLCLPYDSELMCDCPLFRVSDCQAVSARERICV